MELTDTDTWGGLLGTCPPWASLGLALHWEQPLLRYPGTHTQSCLIHAGAGYNSPAGPSRDLTGLGQASSPQ